MKQYNYKFEQVDPNTVISPDTYSVADDNLIADFKVNSSFNQVTDFIELHYYSLDGRLLSSVPTYTNFRSPQDSQTANQGTLDAVTLRTEDDLVIGGFEEGDVYLLYNFLTDPYTEDNSKLQFFIEEISPDRFEVRLLTTKLSNEEVESLTNRFKAALDDADSSDFILNLGSNELLLATNIDTLPYKDFTSVVIRLYNQLPEEINTKAVVHVNQIVSDTVSYLSSATFDDEVVKPLYLKGPNFNIDEGSSTSAPSQYFSIEEAFSYPITNSYYEVRSLYEEKGAQLAIDHTEYSNFINFSSAEERLRNFKYKFDLITQYQAASSNLLNINSYSTASSEYYTQEINSIISNFDHYDRYLYYETGSFAWPKQGTTKPYTLLTGAATGSWFDDRVLSASIFDAQNPNQLINTIPEYLREDPSNAKYVTFVHMMGQHFDNLWIYAKAVTDKYDADNRLNFGISKDLIEDALKNFGVKLYNSNKSTQELFKMFTGETYSTGSENYVTEVISGSAQNISEEDYRKQLYKRLYHNLPYLVKSKGTERGLRALLSSFGVPSLYSSGSNTNTGSLFITQYGGTTTEGFNLGSTDFVTSSLDRIRIDNTGSIEGNTLSQYISINKRDSKYSIDTNEVEAGYSPSSYLNQYIISGAKAEGFDIDSILGDPGLAYSSSYNGLISKAKQYLTPTTGSNYNLKDFTRVLKFYDNVLFKTIKDFTPAKSNLSTGIIIKPHLLERSKAKQVELGSKDYIHLSGSYDSRDTGSLSLVKKQFVGDISLTGSLPIGSRTGSSAGAFGGQDQYSASYEASVMTADGPTAYNYHNQEEAKYDGEFSGSNITISTGELNDENIYKYDKPGNASLKYNFINADADCEIIWGEYTLPVPLSPTPSVTPSKTATPAASPPNSPAASPGATVSVTPTKTKTPTPTKTPSPTPASAYCRFVWVSNTVDGSRYGLRYLPPGGSVTDVIFNSLFGTPYNYGGTDGIVYGVCSTLSPSIWDSNTNTTTPTDGTNTVDFADGGSCTINTDCEFVPNPSPTPTVTPSVTRTMSPTPSPQAFESFVVRYDANSDLTACSSTDPTITVYSLCNPITTPGGTNCYLYNSQDITDFVDGGYYADTVSGNYYYVEGNGNGLVQEVGSCGPATPAPSPAPSPQPCSEIAMTTVGQTDPGTACLQTPDALRSHNGSNFAEPTVGDTIYGKNCVTPFNGGGLWYTLDFGVIIRVSTSGVVLEKIGC